MLLELALIGGTVESLVHADTDQLRETFAGLLDHRYDDLIVGGLFHHLVMENETILIFEHAHAQSELHRYTGLALADPLGMRLEDREHFLFMGDRLALEDTPADLVDLPLGMDNVGFELGQQ